MRFVIIILFIFFNSKGFCQLEKVVTGTTLTYKYSNIVTTNNGDNEDTLSKKTYLYSIKVDSVLHKGQNKIIVFDKILDPFLIYKGEKSVSQVKSLLLIKKSSIFLLKVDSKEFGKKMSDQILIDSLFGLLNKFTSKSVYKVGVDVTNFKVGGIDVNFIPFIELRENNVDSKNIETSYTGYFKFYKYIKENKIRNIVTSDVSTYQKNDFIRKSDATINFSSTYGLVTSSAYVLSGEKSNVFILELIKVEQIK